jgi:hypothetical protein
MIRVHASFGAMDAFGFYIAFVKWISVLSVLVITEAPCVFNFGFEFLYVYWAFVNPVEYDFQPQIPTLTQSNTISRFRRPFLNATVLQRICW